MPEAKRKRSVRGRSAPRPKPKVTVDNFRKDPLYPGIARAVKALLSRGKVVAPVDVLVETGRLDPDRLLDWRRGRIPYLEKVIHCNLGRLSRLLRVLRMHAHELNLVPTVTEYRRWGKGPKQRLRFTKTRDPKLEEAYSRHFVWPGKGPFHPPKPRRAREADAAETGGHGGNEPRGARGGTGMSHGAGGQSEAGAPHES